MDRGGICEPWDGETYPEDGRGVVTFTSDTCTEEELQELYGLLDQLHLTPSDIIRELKKEGITLHALSSLSSLKCRALIRDCKRLVKT